MRIYAIGDIHGQFDMLKQVHDWIEQDKKQHGDDEAQIVHLGDYTDRGPNSRAVIEYLMNGINSSAPWIAIRGNHDRMFTRFVRDGTAFDPRTSTPKSWLDPALGGQTTLASYGIEACKEETHKAFEQASKIVPHTHLEFLENLPLTYQWQGYLFVHAGIRPDIALEDQDEDDLIWIRQGWDDYEGPLPWKVIHGHTALKEPTDFGNRIDIDVGAGYGRQLCAIVIEDEAVFSITEAGRSPIKRQ